MAIFFLFTPPQGWCFLLAARQSVQAPSALAPQRRFLFPLFSFLLPVIARRATPDVAIYYVIPRLA